jgi:hypothetical protein
MTLMRLTKSRGLDGRDWMIHQDRVDLTARNTLSKTPHQVRQRARHTLFARELPRLSRRYRRSPAFSNHAEHEGGLQCEDGGFGVDTPIMSVNPNGHRMMCIRV